jgi:hypothetical protein
MRIKLQKISIDVEKLNAIHNADDEYREQLWGGGPGPLSPHDQQLVQTMSDREYLILMEERYGILEEGIF